MNSANMDAANMDAENMDAANMIEPHFQHVHFVAYRFSILCHAVKFATTLMQVHNSNKYKTSLGLLGQLLSLIHKRDTEALLHSFGFNTLGYYKFIY